jgi:tRNA G18 (ribose-2'-O)-methylase SpoU
MARLIAIDDLDDPRLAIYRHVKRTNHTRDLGQFVLEGEKLLDALLASDHPVASVLVTDRKADAIAAKVPGETPVYVVPHERIGEIVGYGFHLGVVSSGVRLPPPDLDAVMAKLGPRATLIVCPRIDNPENLGSIVRLADVFGAAAVVVGGKCPDPLSRRVLRVSMGTALARPVLAADDLAPLWDRLRTDHRVRFAAAVTDTDATPFDRYQRPDRLALVLGCEGTGLEPPWLDRCEDRITIPMRPGAESLNVALAAGILLHRLTLGAAGPAP